MHLYVPWRQKLIFTLIPFSQTTENIPERGWETNNKIIVTWHLVPVKQSKRDVWHAQGVVKRRYVAPLCIASVFFRCGLRCTNFVHVAKSTMPVALSMDLCWVIVSLYHYIFNMINCCIDYSYVWVFRQALCPLLHGTCRPPWGKSAAYCLSPITTASMVPPLKWKEWQSLEIFFGTWPTIPISSRTNVTAFRSWMFSRLASNTCSGALRTGSRQKTRIEHQHSRTHIMKAIRDVEMCCSCGCLLT